MGHREHTRQLEDAIDQAAAACLKQNPVEAFKALAPFCSEDIGAKSPDAQLGDKAGAAPADGTKGPATASTPGTAAAPPPTDERARRRNPRLRRRSLY